MIVISAQILNQKPVRVIVFTGLFVLSVAIAQAVLPAMGDDLTCFRDASEALLAGHSPYTVDQFMLAPWSLALFVPLSLLPAQLSLAVMTVTGIAAYAYAAIKLGARPVGLAAIILSPQIMHCLINGNVDWLVVVGFTLPPQIGLFLLAIKPQIGLPLILYWGLQAWREKRLVSTFAPFALACGAALVIFGWPLQMQTVQPEYNASLWPWSLPVGLVLLFFALYRRRERLAQGIGPLLSPHVMFHSWAAPLFALAPDTPYLVLGVLFSWLFVAARWLS